jgi:pimeloyl-ACP methyl ester carboxylesterase
MHDFSTMEGKHFKIVECADSKRLMVFLAGTDKTDGKFDFWHVGNAQSSHLLFLNNGRNEWYQRGIPGFGDTHEGTVEKLKALVRYLNVDEVFFVGVSMGGYGAVLYGAALDAKVLAFGYDTKLKIDGSRSHKRMPKDIPEAFPDLRPLIEASKVEVLQIAGECDSLDLLAAAHVYDLSNVKTMTLTGVGHGGAPFIKEFYGLSEFISTWANGEPLPDIVEAGGSVNNSKLVGALYKTFLAFRDRDWAGVKVAAAEAIELDPRHEYSNYMLGTALLEEKSYAESLAPLLISVGSAPHYLGARYRLGRALMLNKRHAYAKVHFAMYLKSNPKAHIVLMMLSDIYMLEGNKALAAKYLAESLECGGDAEKLAKRMAKLAA